MANTPETKTDEFAASITALADRYKLEGDERDQFIHQHMIKAGYTVERSYKAPEANGGGNGNGKSSGWFKD